MHGGRERGRVAHIRSVSDLFHAVGGRCILGCFLLPDCSCWGLRGWWPACNDFSHPLSVLQAGAADGFSGSLTDASPGSVMQDRADDDDILQLLSRGSFHLLLSLSPPEGVSGSEALSLPIGLSSRSVLPFPSLSLQSSAEVSTALQQRRTAAEALVTQRKLCRRLSWVGRNISATLDPTSKKCLSCFNPTCFHRMLP